jgi:succinate-semialdehyde dehydrogenase/glutarate-semialdehyde dehydrogenase
LKRSIHCLWRRRCTVSSAIISKFKVTGQSCVCANLFFIPGGCLRAVRSAGKMKKFQVGDGQNSASTHGFLSNGVAKTQEGAHQRRRQ